MELLITLGKAFLVGGLFCAVGPDLDDKIQADPARILVGYVVAGVLCPRWVYTSRSWSLQGQAQLYR